MRSTGNQGRTAGSDKKGIVAPLGGGYRDEDVNRLDRLPYALNIEHESLNDVPASVMIRTGATWTHLNGKERAGITEWMPCGLVWRKRRSFVAVAIPLA